MSADKFTEQQVAEWARLAYEEWNADFEIVTNRCALLVIDMQDEFVKPGWTPYWVPEATRQIDRINKLIGHCRNKEIPVIFTVFSKTNSYLDRSASGRYMPNRYRRLDIDQSKFFNVSRVYSELDYKQTDTLIHKPTYGAFYDTPLRTILGNLKRDTVIICGTLTNYCCGMTARQAYERGFKVVFGSDLNSADLPEMHENELKVLRKGFAMILSSDQIIEALA